MAKCYPPLILKTKVLTKGGMCREDRAATNNAFQTVRVNLTGPDLRSTNASEESQMCSATAEWIDAARERRGEIEVEAAE